MITTDMDVCGLRKGNYPEDGGIRSLTEMRVVFNVYRIRAKMEHSVQGRVSQYEFFANCYYQVVRVKMLHGL
jgi:hypothetical protein